MKHLRAKAMILAFLKGAPIPPNEIAAKIIVIMCGFGFNGTEWKWEK